jgi:hypothetical protein
MLCSAQRANRMCLSLHACWRAVAGATLLRLLLLLLLVLLPCYVPACHTRRAHCVGC